MNKDGSIVRKDAISKEEASSLRQMIGMKEEVRKRMKRRNGIKT